MRAPFVTQVNALKNMCSRFDEDSNQQKKMLLMQINSMNLPAGKSLKTYFNALLFLSAYPADSETLALAGNELNRITMFIHRHKLGGKPAFINSGIPFTQYVSRFSHDLVQWILSEKKCGITIQEFHHPTISLNEVLKLTLPALERSETTAGLSAKKLFEALLVSRQNQLNFLMNELSKLNITPYIKDHLYDGLGIYTIIKPRDESFSRAFNRLKTRSVFFHTSLLKHFEHEKLFDQKLPNAEQLTKIQKEQSMATVKISMAITDRETDPTTYMDERSFRLFKLDRGISVAIYGMIAPRQLPLESYAGYTFFKNGFPAAYGGGWVFGQYANFGIHVFESFRGGESSYMLCQLLRVYRQVFNVSYFEIEPYQFGLGNPDGIESGVFWFYYRLGFRPTDKKLSTVANNERKKIESRKNYRTGRETLKSFTASTMALNLGSQIPVKVFDITLEVTKMMRQNYNGDRRMAESDCIAKFKNKTSMRFRVNADERKVLQDVALWAEALQITDKAKLRLLSQMINVKPVDLYNYQKLLLEFFAK